MFVNYKFVFSFFFMYTCIIIYLLMKFIAARDLDNETYALKLLLKS